MPETIIVDKQVMETLLKTKELIEELLETLDILADKELMFAIKESEEEVKKGKTRTLEEFIREEDLMDEV